MGKPLPFDTRVQLFTNELAALCSKYGVVLRGQIPQTILHAYAAEAPPECIDGAKHDSRTYRCIDLRNLHCNGA